MTLHCISHCQSDSSSQKSCMLVNFPQLAQPVHLDDDRLLLFDVKGALKLRRELIGVSARLHATAAEE